MAAAYFLLFLVIAVLQVLWNVTPCNAFNTRLSLNVHSRFRKLSMNPTATVDTLVTYVAKAKIGFVPPPGSDFQVKKEPVHSFAKGAARVLSKKAEKEYLGGKGANLAEMSSMGLSVPPGFTIITEVCSAFHKGGKMFPKLVWFKVL